MRRARTGVAVVVGLLTVAALGCRGRSDAKAGYQGVVELHERALGFEVPGRLATLKVIRGQEVQAGQILATLDEVLEQEAVAAKQADADAADAQLALLKSGARPQDIRGAEAQLRAAKAQEDTQRDVTMRDRQLSAANAIPQAQLDTAEGQLRHATAIREAAEQTLAELRAGSRHEEIGTAQARAAEAHAALDAEKERLHRFELQSPIAGTVLDTHAEPGEVVQAAGPVVTVGETARPYVDVFVPQGELGGLRDGTAATVRVDSVSAALHGRIESVGRTLEFTPRFLFSEKERPNLVVRVRVNVEDPSRLLHAGVPAFVQFERGAAR